MPLLVLAYPQLSPVDYAWVQAIRRAHDQPLYQVVEPHFTLVFPTMNIASEKLTEHVRDATQGVTPISFILRSALVVKDTFSVESHVFLVPDEGFGSLVKLHDLLYTGILAPELRLDIPYIPHLTIGHSADALACQKLATDLNAQNFSVSGRIAALEVVRYENQHIESLRKIVMADD